MRNLGLRDVLEQGKRALPESSCLVIGAMDRAAKVGDEIVSLRVMPDLLKNQQQAAFGVGARKRQPAFRQ